MLVAAIAAPWIIALLGVAPGADDDDDRRELRLQAGSSDQVIETIVDRLDDGDVLSIVVRDGEAGAAGSVQQCRLEPHGARGCGNVYPILFDDDGRATFQYQVRDDGTCGATATCVVVAQAGGAVAIAFTVFGDEAPPPPTVRLSPAGPVAPGSAVRVDVSGLLPGAPIRAAFCGQTCGATRSIVAGDGGTASLDVSADGSCRACEIVVVSGAAVSRVPVTLLAPPSARYDTWRLFAGLAACAAFLLTAWWLIRIIDWRPPSEAAIPD